MPRVSANGREIDLPADGTVADLLTAVEVRARFLVVERNGRPVAREAYSTTRLADGDRLEIVSPVGGG